MRLVDADRDVLREMLPVPRDESATRFACEVPGDPVPMAPTEPQRLAPRHHAVQGAERDLAGARRSRLETGAETGGEPAPAELRGLASASEDAGGLEHLRRVAVLQPRDAQGKRCG